MKLRDQLSIAELWSLWDEATDGAWLWHVARDEIEWSPKLCAILGYAATVRTVAEIMTLVHPDDRITDGGPILDPARRSWSCSNVRFRTNDGRYIPFGIYGARLKGDDDGRVAGIIINQSRAAAYKQGLERSEARLRAFLDNCPAGVFIKNTDDRHLYANEAASDIMGLPLDALIGRRTSELFPSDVADRLQTADRAALASDAPIISTEVMQTPRGPRHVLDVKFNVPDIESDATLVGAFALDVTDKVEREDELRALDRRLQDKQRLESLGLLAGGIAHDFNNLLQMILGHAQLADTGDPEERQENLRIVSEQCKQAANLCSQLLTYSGRRPVQLEPVDAGQLLRDASELLDVSRHRGIALGFSIPETLPAVIVDATQLRQVLLNLVMNGAQAVEHRPSAELSVSCDLRSAVEPRPVMHSWLPTSPNELLRIRVRDNGPGMDAQQARRAFEPFFSTKSDGHGLGLSIVLGIVRAHGGAIGVDTHPEKGTCVEVYLPTIQTAVTKPAKTDEPDVSFAGQTVLVVDDQPAVLRTAVRLLEQLGIRVVAATSGAEALEELAANGVSVDLALVDLTMPKMGGLELAKRLTQAHPGLPVILMSGYAQETNGAVAGFLQKPYSQESLRTCLRTVLGVTRP